MVDLKTGDGLERAKQLIASADVLIENFRSPAVMERLGLGYEMMAAVNPRIIYVQASAFGREGPWVGMFSHEWIAQTVSGFVSVTGDDEGVPEWSRATANQDWNGAMMNLAVVLAGLIRREQTGHGMMIETAQLGSSIFAGITRFAELFATGRAPRPMGSARPNLVPDQAFKTADGYINVCIPTEKFWSKLSEALGDSGLKGKRFATNDARVANREELTSVLNQIFQSRGSKEWITQLQAAGVPCGFHEYERRQSDVLLEDKQARANSMLQRVPTPHGEIRSQSPHWRFERTPAEIRRGCPLLGQDTDRVFAQLPSVDRTNHAGVCESANGEQTGNPGAGVLASLRVIEIAQGVAGPLSGMMLRRFGAAVTKIEPPQGDWLRRIPPKIGTDSALFLELNPGKQSLVLDLKTASARAQLARIARDADVVISGLGDNALARLGLGYEELRRDNPRMIYCSISGWGRQGPMADFPATELAVQAMAGLRRHLGAKDGRFGRASTWPRSQPELRRRRRFWQRSSGACTQAKVRGSTSQCWRAQSRSINGTLWRSRKLWRGIGHRRVYSWNHMPGHRTEDFGALTVVA